MNWFQLIPIRIANGQIELIYNEVMEPLESGWDVAPHFREWLNENFKGAWEFRVLTLDERKFIKPYDRDPEQKYGSGIVDVNVTTVNATMYRLLVHEDVDAVRLKLCFSENVMSVLAPHT